MRSAGSGGSISSGWGSVDIVIGFPGEVATIL